MFLCIKGKLLKIILKIMKRSQSSLNWKPNDWAFFLFQKSQKGINVEKKRNGSKKELGKKKEAVKKKKFFFFSTFQPPMLIK